METRAMKIGQIPALLWGPDRDFCILAVHGSGSHKADAPIERLAAVAVPRGYQVLSFDLPEHGARQGEPALCKPQTCIPELGQVLAFAKGRAAHLSLWANSLGAYFSLLAYADETLHQALLLSPVVDMQRLIANMMQWFGVSEERLRAEKEIATPIGQTLYWDYAQYVKQRAVTKWTAPTAILYGGKDTLCEREVVTAFAARWRCRLTICEEAEHYFHTPEDLSVYEAWLRETLLAAE